MPNVKGHVMLVVDESGSMSGRRSETVAGLNEFIEELRRETTVDYDFSLMFFDSDSGASRPGGVPGFRSRYFAEGLPLAELYRPIELDDYKPSGGTPLFDAVQKGLGDLSRMVGDGERAVMVVFTDGEENASREVRDFEALRRAIAEKEAAGWRFVYIGVELPQWASRSIAQGIGFTGATGAARFTGPSGSGRGVGQTINAYYTVSSSMSNTEFQAAINSNVAPVEDDAGKTS